MATTYKILTRTRQLLARRRGWCQKTAAMTADGEALLLSRERGAVRFCLSAAIERAVSELGGGRHACDAAHWAVFDAICDTYKKYPGSTRLDVIVQYNDTRGRRKRDVLRVLDKARAACRRG